VLHRRPLLLLPILATAAVLWFVLGPPDIDGLLTDLSDTLGTWTYLLVGGLAFLETGAFVGLIAPGETAIVLGGVVAASGRISLAAVLLVAWVCAALGDLASFWLGRRLGHRFLHRQSVIPARHIAKVERFYTRHGAKAILVGRFVGLVRAISPFLAGSSGLSLRGFLPWSVLGTFVWASAFTLVGFMFAESFASAAHTLTYGAFGLAVLACLVLVWHQRRRHRLAFRP
jgi:membrane protein DedA with SNARE-associated domain